MTFISFSILLKQLSFWQRSVSNEIDQNYFTKQCLAVLDSRSPTEICFVCQSSKAVLIIRTANDILLLNDRLISRH
ncbi:unnamed protein product [Schistosoma curassoni]|uniref:Secreted protein n=1 Tax=Schistosoma curassoni TaxID=6186 RepID=A0A183KN68_9TREM|nr:unnamed protein product [Schistosoma curassoni]